MNEPTDAPHHGATPDDGQDSLAAFLASNELLLNKVYGYLCRRMRDSAAAADAFYDTAKSFVAYADRTALAKQDYLAVLMRIANRRATDAWRAQARRAAREVLVAPTDMLVLTDVLADPYTQVDRRLDVMMALKQLSEQQCRALVLRAVDQFSLSETAAIMSVSVSRVKQLIKAAQAAIKRCGQLCDYGISVSQPRQKVPRIEASEETSEAQA